MTDDTKDAMQTEPVAWRFKVKVWLGGDNFVEQWRATTYNDGREGLEPLYAAPQQTKTGHLHDYPQEMAELKRRIKDEPGFAKSLLRDAGIINENGTLAERFGGKA